MGDPAPHFCSASPNTGSGNLNPVAAAATEGHWGRTASRATGWLRRVSRQVEWFPLRRREGVLDAVWKTQPMLEVRGAVAADAMAIAGVHVRSWQEGYRGLLPDEYLNGLRAEDRASRYRFELSRPIEN